MLKIIKFYQSVLNNSLSCSTVYFIINDNMERLNIEIYPLSKYDYTGEKIYNISITYKK